MQGIDAHQFCKLKKISDASRFFQRLIRLLATAEDSDVAPVLIAEPAHFIPALLQPLGAARHSAVFPHDAAELAMK